VQQEVLLQFLKDALFEQGLVLSAEALKARLIGSHATELAIAAGVAIGLLANKAIRLRRSQLGARPHQYLTEVIRAQDDCDSKKRLPAKKPASRFSDAEGGAA
jgi:hypothetical protein